MIRSTGGLSPSAHRFTPRLRQRQRRRQQVACARGGSWRSDLVMGVEKDGVEWWFNGIRYYINGDLMVFNGDLMGFNADDHHQIHLIITYHLLFFLDGKIWEWWFNGVNIWYHMIISSPVSSDIFLMERYTYHLIFFWWKDMSDDMWW